MKLRTGQAGLTLIRQFEGCRLTAYMSGGRMDDRVRTYRRSNTGPADHTGTGGQNACGGRRKI